MTTLYLILLIILIVVGGTFIYGGITFAPWVPMKRRDIDRMLALAKLSSGKVFYDLGCGSGASVLHAAKIKGVKARGVEINILLWLVCELLRLFSKNDVKFFWGDLFKFNVSNADVIYVFGMPDHLRKKFIERVVSQLKPGTRILSYVFEIKGLNPVKVDKPGKKDFAIWEYVV